MAISNEGEKEGLLIKMITEFERIKTNYQAVSRKRFLDLICHFNTITFKGKKLQKDKYLKISWRYIFSGHSQSFKLEYSDYVVYRTLIQS